MKLKILKIINCAFNNVKNRNVVTIEKSEEVLDKAK